MEHIPKSTRRGFLKKATLLVVGALGGAITMRGVSSDTVRAGPPSAPQETSFKLYGRYWHLHSQHRKRGQVPVMGDQMVIYGELLKESRRTKVGEFYSSCLHIRSPFGPSLLAASNVEVHTFNLADGSLLGMGTTREALGGEEVFAILGGTGRYAGARGSYMARQRPQELGGDGTAEFSFNVAWDVPRHTHLIPTREV